MKRGVLVQLRPHTGIEDLSDEGLVAACAAGDRAALALLFERHVYAVHRFVSRMAGTDADAIDDLVQATFVSAYQAAARCRGTRVRAWLFGIAANHVRGFVRREIRRKHAMRAAAELVAETIGPANPDLARLPGAIAALPHDLRTALVLIDLEGEKGKDAAAALGIPEGTLWRRVFHARQALRAALGGAP
jgi:RNA polymerase sigma-70 factor (ECF subfamily)